MIKKATLTHLDALSKLFNQYRIFYKQKSNIEEAKRFLTERISLNESVIYVAATAKDELVGFLQLYPLFSSTQMKRLWLLNDLFVQPAYRRQGYSIALINAAKTLCIKTKACGLFLETEKTNVEGSQLYPKMGFIKDNAHHYYFWDG